MPEIKIDGFLTVPAGTEDEEVWAGFIAFIEAQGWSFGGEFSSDDKGFELPTNDNTTALAALQTFKQSLGKAFRHDKAS